MRGSYLHKILGASSFLALMAGSTAHAQAAEPSQSNAAMSGTGLDEIVVTANKREQNLQKVPSAVTAVTGDTLISRGVTDVRSLPTLATNLKMTTNGTDTEFFIRGVGPGVGGTGNDPAVSLNIDGAYIIRYAASGAFFDLDRVEVLYGPQGTLYGRNSTAGVINVISKGPTDKFEGSIVGEYGNYNLFHGTAAVNLPITSTLKVRMAFDTIHHDGYVSTGRSDDKGLNTLDNNAARLTVLWEPTSRLSIRAKVEYWHGGGSGQISVDYPFIKPNNPWYTPYSASDWGTYNNSYYYVANGQAQYDFGSGIKLTYIPTFLDSRTDYKTANGGADALSAKVPTTMTRRFILPWDSFSNELRLSGDRDKYHWLVGLYEYEGDSNADKGLALSYRAFPGLSTLPPGRIQYSGRNNTEEKARAIFGQFGYSIAPALRFTLGGRYSSDIKDEHTYPGSTTTYGRYTATGKDQTTVTGSEVIAQVKSKNFDWKVGGEWDVAPQVMLYANVGTGFLDGGVLLQPPPGIPATFKPEHLTQYAVGMKGEFFDRKLRINTEAYYYDYTGYQLSTSIISPIGGNIVTTTLNADKVRIYGVDGEIDYKLAARTQLSARMSYLPTAKIVDFVSAAGNYSGFRMPQAARFTGSFDATQGFDLGDAGTLSINGEAYISSGYWGSYTHTSGYQTSFQRYDGRITYTPDGSKWDFSLWGKNLSNKAVFATGTLGFVDIGEPRTFGVRASLKF